MRLLIFHPKKHFEEKLKGIITRQLDLNSFDNQSVELSTGQFADFFQVSDVSNARRILRRIYNSSIRIEEYKGYQVKVHNSGNQYVATVTPLSEKTSSIDTLHYPLSKAANETLTQSFLWPFCDWLTIHQEYDFDLPFLNDGCVVSLKHHPERSEESFSFSPLDIEFLTTKFVSHGGSYETNLQLRVDGRKLTLSGNVGRFCRPDNLFGFSILDCITKANLILDSLQLGLPHFSVGNYIPPQDLINPCRKPRKVLDPLRSVGGKDLFVEQNAHVIGYEKRVFSENGKRYQVPKYGYIETKNHYWTGAWISQLHLTKNLLFQTSDEAKQFMNWACRQNPWGMTVHPHYGQGVNYGKGSAYVSPKLYLKGLEILENKKYRIIDSEYKDKLIDYIENRIVRFEINYKKFLGKNGIKYLGDIMNEEKRNVLYVDFKNRLDKVLGNDINFYENLEQLSRRRREQFFSWTRGDDLRNSYSRATYFRLLREFKEKLNVDVSLPYSEQESILKIRTLTCQEITQIPEFYEVSEFDKNFKLIA